MKKYGKFLCAACAAALATTAAAGAASESAKPSTHKIYVDGEKASAAAYEINGNNYFKIRDVAAILSGTAAQFDVTWDPATGNITLTDDKAYTKTGDELYPIPDSVQIAEESTEPLYRDGERVYYTGYNVNDNNYYKLRDIAEDFDFGVTWDGATQSVYIETDEEYVPEDQEPAMKDIDVSKLPQSLLDFFTQFGGAYSSKTDDPTFGIPREYDADNAADGTSNIMANIVSELPCVVFNQYPVAPPETHWNDPDPVGWSTTGSFKTFDGPSTDWIATNIFNASQEDLAALVAQGEEERLFKRLENADGSYAYYIPFGGVGGTFRYQEFLCGQSDGTNYRLVYDQYITMGTDDRSRWQLDGTYYAEMEDKVIDGKHYWSMHLHTEEIPEDMLA